MIASIYTSGRDERNFSQADQFLPYRWDRNDPRRKGLPNHIPTASLPFALGARSCIGKKIAMMQMTELVYQVWVFSFVISKHIVHHSFLPRDTQLQSFYIPQLYTYQKVVNRPNRHSVIFCRKIFRNCTWYYYFYSYSATKLI